eukprot:1158278-Pelagomonas_calceolata.AAC.6
MAAAALVAAFGLCPEPAAGLSQAALLRYLERNGPCPLSWRVRLPLPMKAAHCNGACIWLDMKTAVGNIMKAAIANVMKTATANEGSPL